MIPLEDILQVGRITEESSGRGRRWRQRFVDDATGLIDSAYKSEVSKHNETWKQQYGAEKATIIEEWMRETVHNFISHAVYHFPEF